MASKEETIHLERVSDAKATDENYSHHAAIQPNVTNLDDEHIQLTWKSWVVVFISCFAVFSQIMVVVAASSVIAFIVRDLGVNNSGWIIQGPLLMQSVLSPFMGRLSDVLDRKMLSAVPPLIAFAGAVISAKANSMGMLIGGGILIGTTLATISIVQSIPSEVLPMKYRPLANGLAFFAGATGGLVGGLGAGHMTNLNPGGWRNIFWVQAAFHLATAAGFLFFYWPKKKSDYPRMTLKEYIWAIDPIGSVLFVVSATLMLLALDWAGGAYAWSDAHVAAPLGIGLGVLVLFCLYEWKGRSDGIVAHVFFRDSPNFGLSCFAFAVEGWIFYSAVNAIVPQIMLNLGFATNSWTISIRQLAYSFPTITCSILVTWYATRYKDLKWPLMVTFAIFLVVTVLYGCIRPDWKDVQLGMNVIAGVGQAGPLTLIVALVQFTAPHKYLSTATGLAFSARSIGGAFGSAVLDAIVNNKLGETWAKNVSAAAIKAGLPSSSVAALLAAMTLGKSPAGIAGITPEIMAAATHASEWAYTRAYRLAWWSIFPFVVIAMVAIWFLKDVKDLMTDKVEATVENIEHSTKVEQA